MPLPTLFVGVGSPHGDDSAGWLVADALQAQSLPGLRVRKVAVPIDLLDEIDGCERLLTCDACHGIGEIGSMHLWKWPDLPAEWQPHSGSHDLGLRQVLELAERLQRLPGHVEIWGIEVGWCNPGEPVSAELMRLLPEAIAALAAAIGRE